MRDRFEEPFEFRVRTQGASVSARRPKDSLRVGALVLALGVSALCAVFWPSQPKKAAPDANEQNVATQRESSQEELASDAAPRGSFEELILNDGRSDIEEESALELADASLVEEEETQEKEPLQAEFVSQNPVASTAYEERQKKAQIASSSFETQVESKSDDAREEKERTSEEAVAKDEQKRSTPPQKGARSSSESETPGYFARAANLPGRHNSFSLRNFARAANLVDPSGAYSPRSLTNAAQVDDSKVEVR